MIDANRQSSWMLASAQAFDLAPDRGDLVWDATRQVLRFRSARTFTSLPDNRAAARHLADQPPMTLDRFGTWAGLSASGDAIIAGGVFDDPIELLALPAGDTLVDMAMNPDGVLYAVSRDAAGVSTIHLINRLGSRAEDHIDYEGYDANWYDTEAVKTLQTGVTGQPDRVAALARGGALLLDRARRLFFQVLGTPCRDQPRATHAPATPRPCMDGAPAQTLIPRPDLVLPDRREAVAMASNTDGQVAVLLFPHDAQAPAEVVLIQDAHMSASMPLAFTGAPFSIGWVAEDRWAVLFADMREAVVYPLPFLVQAPSAPLLPTGYRYPLHWGDGAAYKNRPLVNTPTGPAHYPSSDRNGIFQARPLHPLSFPAYPIQAEVEATRPIDSGMPGMVWHRLYLEAHIPPGSAVRVYLAAADNADALDAPRWHAHHFGSGATVPEEPRGVWIQAPSEIPFHQGLLGCRPEKNRSGLFTALVQRSGLAVRTLKGRYLKVKVRLSGSGHESPEIAALRIYGPRFSYLDRYLPELYRETLGGEAADAPGPATGPDFLQRFLSLFEGVLTPLEDKVAAAHMVTNPLCAPADALDWLAGWVAVSPEQGLTEKCKRDAIRHATQLYRLRGTLQGLALALDLATEQSMRRGDIVLLEDFRLRRTFATILGADLSVANDPLMVGDIPNANSYLGNTLILGEASKHEFLALYADDLPKTSDEAAEIDNFYARLANRLTVLVHRETDGETLALIRRIVASEVPAHIAFRVVPASKPLLVGLYALVGIDTYLRETPPRQTARIGHSYLGHNDFIKKFPVLDDRLEP